MALALRRSYGNSAPASQEQQSVGSSSSPGLASRGGAALGAFMLAVARLVRFVTTVVVVIIVAAIVLRLLNANPSNTIVNDIHSVASTLVGAFKNMFSFSRPKVTMAVNWGIAALVYAVVGGVIARLIARAAPTGVGQVVDPVA